MYTKTYDINGKNIIITGGNTGLGYECAKTLINMGANVYIICRNKEKGEEAVRKLGDKATLITLDIADLNKVNEFTSTFVKRDDVKQIDVLINNAGVMNIKSRTLTEAGIEMQLAVNHVGHYALTMGLLPKLKKSNSPRVITVASIAAYMAKLDFGNLNGEKWYKPYSFYKTSKLCNILFSQELCRRVPWLTSIAVHPGVVHTNIQRNMKNPTRTFFKAFQFTFGQSMKKGIIPIIKATVQENVKSGTYYGPVLMTKGKVWYSKKPWLSTSRKASTMLWEWTKRNI